MGTLNDKSHTILSRTGNFAAAPMPMCGFRTPFSLRYPAACDRGRARHLRCHEPPSSAAYTTANQLSSLTRFTGASDFCPMGDSFGTTSETFKYNVNNQLTDIEAGAAVGGIPYQSTLKDGSNYILAGYHYSATQNNGQITSMDDGRQGYSVTYQYDLLKRLVSATAGSTWTQTFGYDGFGNLTSKSTPSGSSELPLPGVNAAKNWLTGYTYDLNGNVASYSNFALAYDPANRLSSATTGSFVETYGYDASNHRIERINSALDTVYFFSPSGALLSEFNCLSTCTLIYNRIYFGGMVLGTDGTTVNGTTLSALGDTFTWTDRLGSAQSTYPYGADIGSYPAGADAVDFATYTKEGSTGLEYAMNRYYSGGLGRFMTPDPSGKGINPANPQTWVSYTYVAGDPTNEIDPSGEFMLQVPFDWSILWPFEGFWTPQPQRSAPADPPSAFPECNPYGNPTTEKKLNWVSNNWGDSFSEAKQIQSNLGNTKVNTGSLATMFLQWSANESNYGTDAADVAENNFFGIQNKGNSAGLFGNTTVVCNRGTSLIAPNSQNACFASNVSWGQELGIALGITSSKTGVTFLSALDNALVNGASMAQALQAIANNGWNASQSYGSRITSTIQLKSQIDCLKKNGYIQ